MRPHRYHLKDVIVGKIYFLLVRIKIKHMELSIIRRETTGTRELAGETQRDVEEDAKQYPARSAQSIQRIRNDHQVRNHGRSSSARRDDPHPTLLGWL